MPYLDWTATPLRAWEIGSNQWCEATRPFRMAFNTPAGTRPVRVGVVGDSRSSMSGAGVHTWQIVQQLVAIQYDNMPGSSFMTSASLGGAPGLGGGMLCTFNHVNGAAKTTGDTYIPRGISVLNYTRNLGTNPVYSSSQGAGIIFGPHWIYGAVNSYANSGPWFDHTTADMSADIICYAYPGSPEAYVRIGNVNFNPAVSTTVGTSCSHAESSVTATSTTTTSMGLDSTANVAKRHTITSTNGFGSNNRMQMRVTSASGAAGIEFASARLWNKTNPRGVIIDNFANTGDSAASFLSAKPDCGTYFQVEQHEAFILWYGANDAAGGTSAATLETNLRSIIAILRAACPNCRIFLIGDSWRGGLTAPQLAELDQYPGVAYVIARSLPNCQAINLRRATHRTGWNSTYHYDDSAAIAWASATAYSVGNIRTAPFRGDDLERAKCRFGHTSAATDNPFSQSDNAAFFWELANPNMYYEGGAMVHATARGSAIQAKLIHDLIWGGVTTERPFTPSGRHFGVRGRANRSA